MSFLMPFKPFLTALVMPIASALLLMVCCVLWAWRERTRQTVRRTLLLVAATCGVGLWLLACQGSAVWLAQHALPQVTAITPHTLKAQRIQAIVVLGGGALRDVAEYQGHVLPPEGMARLLYGQYLHQQTQLPIAYSGGVGWSDPRERASEAQVAADTVKRLGLPALRWLEDQSKDTHQNAQFTRTMLQAEGIERVALVTHAWHMPRSQREFEAAGFERVLPAPMGFVRSDTHPVLQWLPSAGGLQNTQWVLREWLGLQILRP